MIHVFHNAIATNFAASLLFWERLLAERHREKQQEQNKGAFAAAAAVGPPAHHQQRGNVRISLSLTKLVIVESLQLALSVILLGCQMSFSWFSNQYIYILPAWMLFSETYIHFGGGRAD